MAVLFQPSRSRDEKHPWSQACGPLGSHVCGALPPPAPSAGWRGPFSGAQSFQKPARHRSLLSPLTHLPALTGALSLSFSTSQGLGNKSRDPPCPSNPQAEAGRLAGHRLRPSVSPGPRPAWSATLPALHKPVRHVVALFHRQGSRCWEGQASKGAKKPAGTQGLMCTQETRGQQGWLAPRSPTHPTQVSADTRPRRHTPEGAREEGSARGALWTQNEKCLLLLLRPEPFK